MGVVRGVVGGEVAGGEGYGCGRAAEHVGSFLGGGGGGLAGLGGGLVGGVGWWGGVVVEVLGGGRLFVVETVVTVDDGLELKMTWRCWKMDQVYTCIDLGTKSWRDLLIAFILGLAAFASVKVDF